MTDELNSSRAPEGAEDPTVAMAPIGAHWGVMPGGKARYQLWDEADEADEADEPNGSNGVEGPVPVADAPECDLGEAPLVSVIVPMYNSAEWLPQCLESLTGQTYGNLEIVCVDDGSPDESAEIAARYAQEDARIRVVAQENAGPGAARNRGIDEASGELITFLDADDWFAPDHIERMVRRLLATDAQMVVSPFCEFDVRSGLPLYISWGVLPDKYPDGAFSWRDNPDYLFRCMQNFPWNKLLRADFVRAYGLRYDEDITLSEDLMFSAPACVLARRIALTDAPTVFHRIGTGQNVMSTKDRHPFDFITAFGRLKDFLEEHDVYENLQAAYCNWCIDGCLYNLHTLNDRAAFGAVFRRLATGGAAELGLLDFPREAYWEDRYRDFLDVLAGGDAQAYAWRLFREARDGRDLYVYFDRISQARIADGQRDLAASQAETARVREQLAAERERAEQLEEQLAALEAEYDARMNAWEQKVGGVLLKPARAVQRQMLKGRE